MQLRKQLLLGALATALSMGGAPIALADEDGDIAPAPPSIGADIPLTYFGPAPSDVQKELIGPYQLLKSGKVDLDKGTITMPLYRGELESGESVWYVVTDTTDRHNAEGLGLNHSAKLDYAAVGRGVRDARIEKGDDGRPMLVFASGRVDFSPAHKVAAGDAPDFFPPSVVQPGSIGDANYSPLARVANAGGHIYNAPVVAFDVEAHVLQKSCRHAPDHSIMHDKVVSICPDEQTVELALTPGFSFSRPVLYLSTDSSAPLPATLEGATFAPAMLDIPTGGDDSLFSAVERIFLAVNGPHRQRQSATARPRERAHRRPLSAQHARRHPDHRHRLQPAVGFESVCVDSRSHRSRLPLALDRRIRHSGQSRSRLAHRLGRRRIRLDRGDCQLPDRVSLFVIGKAPPRAAVSVSIAKSRSASALSVTASRS